MLFLQNIFNIDKRIINLVLLCVVEIFGDFSLEKYTKTNSFTDLIQGIGWYGGVIFFLIKSLRGSSILYVNGMWDGLSGLIISAAAYFFLGQRFENPLQYFGLGFIIMGVFLLKK
jgi:multidrug transporter EmrE-like cation transporter